jgi:uncharacterized protein YecT (DUF1311 family)
MKSIALIFSLFLLPLCPAQEVGKEKEHPIDIAMDKAIEKNPSTAGMVEAFAAAGEKWDTELNKNYKILIAKLDPDARKALREAQRAWVTQRDKEIDYLIKFYSKMEGTMYRIIYA